MLPIAKEVADTILYGFNRHYRIFIEYSAGALDRFERRAWTEIQDASANRIDAYDQRVNDNIELLKNRFGMRTLDEHMWFWIKQAYSDLLSSHPQPELAESFYNSVFCRMFDRKYFSNDNIFVRTQIDPVRFDFRPITEEFTVTRTDADALFSMIKSYAFRLPFRDPIPRCSVILQRLFSHFVNHQQLNIKLLKPLFFRNKAAYIVGRIDVDGKRVPLLIPILNRNHQLVIDALIFDPEEAAVIFGFARAYFMVKTELPGAVVAFLKSILPKKTASELYTSIGLQKHGKTLFYRDFLQQLESSDEKLVSAPGIKGMVMTVFTLPSYPFVFKLIKDRFAPQKNMTKDTVKQKYRLVKQHDRVGRMADTLEFSHVAFPKNRFSQELLDELEQTVPSQITYEGDYLVLRHCYIERRMIPLNIFLERNTNETAITDAINEYGLAIKEICGVNIFPGDMLFKNFGVTRHGRVIFYDYDEISYLSECQFRDIPEPMYPEQELADEPWYSVGPNDVFPEEFSRFLLTDPNIRTIFKRLHPELLSAAWWRDIQQRVANGDYISVYPYPKHCRIRT